MDDIIAVLERVRIAAGEGARRFVENLPDLLAAVLLLLVGWLIASWLRRLIRALGTRLNRGLDRVLRDHRVERIRLSQEQTRLLSNLVFWIVLFAFLAAATEIANLEALSGWLQRIIAYLPQLLVGAVIIVAGYLLGGIVRALVDDALYSVADAQRELIAKLAQAATFIAAIVLGIDQIGIDVTFVTTVIAIVLAAVLAGFSLAFGLGARNLVANLIAARSLQRYFSVGHRARIGGVEGEILELTATGVILGTAEGRVNVPASRFNEETSVLLSADTNDG
jgi:small-conductance mechanosensitive channel